MGIFVKKDVPYNPSKKELYKIPLVNTLRQGKNSLSFVGSLL